MFGGLNCLLEDYHSGESGTALVKFRENVFEPAFERVEKTLGIKPLLYKLPWFEGFEKYVKCPIMAEKILKEYRLKIENGN